MNIKNPEAHELAQQVAALTGLTLTDAVTLALREKLDRLVPEQAGERDRRLAEARRIVAEMRELAAGGPSLAEINEALYDPETGLPR
jgi:antitoxin VapB